MSVEHAEAEASFRAMVRAADAMPPGPDKDRAVRECLAMSKARDLVLGTGR